MTSTPQQPQRRRRKRTFLSDQSGRELGGSFLIALALFWTVARQTGLGQQLSDIYIESPGTVFALIAGIQGTLQGAMAFMLRGLRNIAMETKWGRIFLGEA